MNTAMGQGSGQGSRNGPLKPLIAGGLSAAIAAAVVVSVMSLQSSPAVAPAPTAAVELAATTRLQPLPQVEPVQLPPPAISAPPAPPPARLASPEPAVQPSTHEQPRQCDMSQRKFYVAGNGEIRIHAGALVSEVITLTPYPQVVAFPAVRPPPGMTVTETVEIEGRAKTMVMTSDLPGFRRVFNGLRGSSSFIAHWQPLRNC